MLTKYNRRGFACICGQVHVVVHLHAFARLGKSKIHGFWGVIGFLQHARKRSPASKIEGFPHSSREVAHIVGGQKHREHARLKR